jgi:methylthioribose-1-phosphate isomerase
MEASVTDTPWSALRWTGDALELLDQRHLPAEERWVRCDSAQDVADAIRLMVVRGAPAIGIAAAWGLVLANQRGDDVAQAAATLLAARPTAVNLRWAVERVRTQPCDRWAAEAEALHAEDVSINRALGDVGARLLSRRAVVWHHCNTGALATGGWGTALGIVRSAAAMGKQPFVYVGETRPWLQGARLTAWELEREGIAGALCVDSAVAGVMAGCDALLVGCDRVALDGAVANKIGTFTAALAARHHGVPVYVAMPLSTLDPRTARGDDIPIETRGADELRGWRNLTWAADFPVHNPVFDVTPPDLVTAWVTEKGLWWPVARAADIGTRLAAWLHAAGLVPATSGNLALRAGRGLLVTPTGRHLATLTPGDWVETDERGQSLGRGRPSAEAAVHAAVLGLGYGASLHAHGGPFTHASRGDDVVLEGLELLKAFPGRATHEGRMVVPVVDNDQDTVALGRAVAAAARAASAPGQPCVAVLVRGHGVYAWGDGPEDAQRHLEALVPLLALPQET